jgi:hypothetical protein
VSRAQLLDDQGEGQHPPSDSQVEDSESEDESQAAQEDESDTSEPAQRQPDVVQTMNQARLEDQRKGLAVSRQLVRIVGPFSYSDLTIWSPSRCGSHSLMPGFVFKRLSQPQTFSLHTQNSTPPLEQTSTRDALHGLLDEALLLTEDLFQLQEVRSSASAPVLRLRRRPPAST